MKRKRIILIVIIALATIAAMAAGLYFYTNPRVWQSTLKQLELAEPEANDLTASGFIEAKEIDIAPELSGRVAELLVEEGEDVSAGKLLVRIDGTLLDAQVELSRAALAIAEAELAQVNAGARAEQIRQAEADLAQAEAARDGAYQLWQDVKAIRDDPQELNVEIAIARSEVKTAEARLTEAEALKDAAVIAYEEYSEAKDSWQNKKENLREELKDLPTEMRPSIPNQIPAQLDFHMIPYQHWKAWIGVNAAKASLQGSQIALYDLLRIRNNPQDLNAQVDAAETEYRAARAAADQAEAQLAALRSGLTREEIAVVEAQLEQAQAALDKLLNERNKLTISAPVGGLVLALSIHEGELAAPGATILTLGDLDEVTLTVYVPQDQLGQVNTGQRVEVQVDSFPDRIFQGTVVAIADEAEFTPRNVQTKEERVNMVFAVDVRIPNPEHELKPGVPADATILTKEQ